MTVTANDSEIFAGAIELSSDDWQDEFVRSACAQNLQQEQRVSALLKIHRKLREQESSQSLLDRPQDVFEAFATSKDIGPGAKIGDFQLLFKLGEGGMGLVYAAERFGTEPRNVAIKLLKPGMDSENILARFELERKVLQQLEHPGITSIFDAGTQPNGRPYLAMELVECAAKITDFCDERNLGIVSRIRLLIEVCGIVQHAHHRGVIHRDLKPSNVLVSRTSNPPKPKVIDFGIAKASALTDCDASRMTHLGERMGTPAYMSPEQAIRSSEIDTRSDVYSLGVLLYEMLTSKTPLRPKIADEGSLNWTSESFWEQEILPPSKRVSENRDNIQIAASRAASQDSLCRELRGELDWITLKALAHRRDQRYQSVAELQQDLERYLSGQPVTAAGPSATYLMRKFLHRNRLLVVSAVSAFAVAIGVAVVSSWISLQMYRAERVSQKHLNEVLRVQTLLMEERDRATSAEGNTKVLLKASQIRTVLDRALSRFINPWVKNLFRFVSERVSSDQEGELTDSVVSNQSVDANWLIAPDRKLIVKGDWDFAIEHLNPRTSILGSRIFLHVSELSNALKSSDASQTTLQSLASRIGMLTLEDRNLFQTLILEEWERELPADDPLLAEILDNCGLVAMDLKDYDRAETYLRRAIEIWSRLKGSETRHVQSQLFFSQCLRQQEKRDAAQTNLQVSIAELEKMDVNLDQVAALLSFAMSLRTALEKPSAN